MKWLLFFLLSALLYADSYRLYEECDEYYDSRGFYHKDCKPNKLKRRELTRNLEKLYNFLEPGKGENNQTQASQTQTPPTHFIDEEDLPPIVKKSKDDEPKIKALKERPTLEYGRE